MAHGARLGSAVMFVQNLDRSVSFCTDVLALEVADRSPTAALLASGGGAHQAVEGRDPDDIVVLITYPGPDRLPLRELPVRIYGW